MKKIMVFLILSLFFSSNVLGGIRSSGIKTPRVNYISPENDSTIDLRDKKSLTFSWKATPIPQGGRRNYKFTLYKGFAYDVVYKEVLDPKIYTIDVPSDLLENNVKYTWKVEQRSVSGGGWSADLRWSFTVNK